MDYQRVACHSISQGWTGRIVNALAKTGFSAVLDDSAARRCARSFSLPVIGTLAVVILAKQHGLIESAAHVLQALRAVNFRLDDAMIRDTLARTVGEKW